MASLLCVLPAASQAWTWHGSLRAKAQVDNRYTHNAHGFGELWGQAYFDAPEEDLSGALDFVGRTTDFDGGNYGKLYQGFIDKGFAEIDSRVKLGRFQRTDNLGFYLVDGGMLTYAPKGEAWSVEVYGGRPNRIDHVRSVNGEFVGGFEGRTRLTPGWGDAGSFASLDTLDLRGGYQHFENGSRQTKATDYPVVGTPALDPNAVLNGSGLGYAIPNPPPATKQNTRSGVDRVSFAATAAGALRLTPKGKYELSALGTFRADTAQFENVLMNAQWDAYDWMRFRGSYEYYRPREPYLTFREKFYSAYALGEQTLARGRVHLTPIDGFTYYLGGMYATRQGDDGYGGDIGGSYALTPNLTLLGEFDYLALGPDNAKSGYASVIHTPDSRLQLRFNSALRYEEKILYGDNRAVGAEGEVRYMLRRDIILNLAGSYIWNTRLRDEYLGAVQVIYYFDPFTPKAM
ncbi:hypothetical protein [Methylomagnum sp.]